MSIDGQLAWLINVRDDLAGLHRCLTRLRQVHPDSRVVVVGDGDSGAAASTAIAHGADYTSGPSLFPVVNGGLIWQRTLDHLLSGPEPWLFKIDTDTVVSRACRAFPAFDCAFGTVQQITVGGTIYSSLQGGCIGLTRRAASQLRDSGVFRYPGLADRPLDTWAVPGPPADRALAGLTSEDWTLGWAVAKLRIPIIPWAEIASGWKVPPPWSRTAAVWHPLKQAAV